MKKIILILSLCLSLLGLSSITYAAEWNWIASNDSTTISFDKDSIRKSEDDKYFAWIKYEHTESEGAKISDDLKLAEPISYQLHRLEFDYKNESIKTQSVVIYDKNGTTLASYTDKYSLERFEPIIPGSIGEKIFYATFAKYQNKYGKV